MLLASNKPQDFGYRAFYRNIHFVDLDADFNRLVLCGKSDTERLKLVDAWKSGHTLAMMRRRHQRRTSQNTLNH